MRCFKAKQKLNALFFNSSEIAKDQMLLNHLNECSACASLVSAEQALRSDLHSAAVDDNEDVVSNWILKAQVERQAANANHSKFRENHLMAIFKNLYKKQSKLTIGITTVVVVLLLSVLIPFSYNKTIGYEVAFAGVDKNLALDSDKIKMLLDKLGVDGAVVDVFGCEATCNVKITELKSPDDAKLVKAMFKEDSNSVLLQDIREVYETKEGNIFKRLSFTSENGSVNDFEVYGNADADDMHNIIVEKIGEDLKSSVFIWVSSDSACTNLNADPASNTFFFKDDNSNSKIDIGTRINGDGNITITINAGTPEEMTIDLPADGVYNTETLQKLEDLGIDVKLIENCIGGNNVQLQLHKIVEYKTDSDEADETDDNGTPKTTGELPEEFELSQNYPNPFNPTTTISFTIPTAQHVSLEIINVQGQVVKTLVDQQISAGTHSIEWDATNEAGSKVASGVYLYKLITPDNTDVKKMTLLK